MNRFKFNAFFEEFPFLYECNTRRGDHQRDPINCDGIKISRISQELLNYTPQYDGSTGSLVGIDHGERFDFILLDGQIVRNAVASDGYITHNDAHTDNESLTGETVLEAIDLHGVAEGLKFIVKVAYGYTIQNHHSLSDYSITIYKAAKDIILTDIIKAVQEKTLAQVRAEANF